MVGLANCCAAAARADLRGLRAPASAPPAAHAPRRAAARPRAGVGQTGPKRSNPVDVLIKIITEISTLFEVSVFYRIFDFVFRATRLRYNLLSRQKRKERSMRTMNIWCPGHSRQTTINSIKQRDSPMLSLQSDEYLCAARR